MKMALIILESLILRPILQHKKSFKNLKRDITARTPASLTSENTS